MKSNREIMAALNELDRDINWSTIEGYAFGPEQCLVAEAFAHKALEALREAKRHMANAERAYAQEAWSRI